MFSLSLPDDVPGVYLLNHKTTKRAHVGAARSLRAEFLRLLRADLEPGWDFSVMLKTTNFNEAQYLSTKAEERARNKGATMVPSPAAAPLGRPPKTTIVKKTTDDISYGSVAPAVAADELGITLTVLYGRMQLLRKRGMTEITLDQLRQFG